MSERGRRALRGTAKAAQERADAVPTPEATVIILAAFQRNIGLYQ